MTPRRTFMTMFDRPITVKDLLWFALAVSVLTTVIVMVVAGLAGQGQKNLAHRVDLNAQLTRLLQSEHNFEMNCILSTKPTNHRPEDEARCHHQARLQYGEAIDLLFDEIAKTGEVVPGLQDLQDGNNEPLREEVITNGS